MAYKAILDRFDMERGDALTLPLDTATELAELPCEIAAPVIHALLKWFTGGEVATLADPRDNALLRRLVVHQRMNAQRRADYLASRRKNRIGGDMSTHDDISHKYKNKSKASEDEALDRDEVNHAAIASLAAGFPALQAEPTAPVDQKQGAITYHHGYFDCDETRGIVCTPCDCDESTNSTTKTRFFADPVTVLMEYPDFENEADKARFRSTLFQRYRTDKDAFKEIAWGYIAEAHHARVGFVNTAREMNACSTCQIVDFCANGCPHLRLKQLAAQYDRDFAGDVFAKNLLGRLKVLKP